MRIYLFFLLQLLSVSNYAQLTNQQIRDLKTGRLPDDSSYIYSLPYAIGKSYIFVQGANSMFSHKNSLAYDFKMKEGSPVHSARGGIVVASRNDSKEGGLKQENLSDGNYIFIKHEDGSIGQYWHFKFGGVLVKDGENVEQSQLIGYSGNTGYSAFPHLHFQVEDANGKEILVRFQTAKEAAYLRPGRAYKAVAVSQTNTNQNKSIAWTVALSHDDKYLAAGNDRGELVIYETSKWTKLKSWKHDHTTISRVEWHPKENILAVAATSYKGTDDIVRLYDLKTEKIIVALPDSMMTRCVSWSPSGEFIAFVGTRGRINIYTKAGALVKSLSFTNQSSLMDIDWHPYKNILLGVDEDIYLIDIEKDSLIATYNDGSKGKGILACQWHPSGNFFVTGDYGHENEGAEPSYLRFWTPDGKLIKQTHESKYEFRNIRWTADGKYMAASSDVLLIYNEDLSLYSKTKFDEHNLWGLSWNRKGDRIITSDQEGKIRMADRIGKTLKLIPQIH